MLGLAPAARQFLTSVSVAVLKKTPRFPGELQPAQSARTSTGPSAVEKHAANVTTADMAVSRRMVFPLCILHLPDSRSRHRVPRIFPKHNTNRPEGDFRLLHRASSYRCSQSRSPVNGAFRVQFDHPFGTADEMDGSVGPAQFLRQCAQGTLPGAEYDRFGLDQLGILSRLAETDM